MPFDLTSQTKMSELLGPMREIGAPLFIASGGDNDETPLFAIVIADGTDASRRLLAATEPLLDQDAATAPETVTDLPTEEIRRRFLTVQREHDGKGFLSPESRVWALDTLEDLLEATERLRKRVQELEPFAECYLQGRNHAADDVIATVGGTVEGNPVNRTNWLQRLRQLVDAERKQDAEIAQLKADFDAYKATSEEQVSSLINDRRAAWAFLEKLKDGKSCIVSSAAASEYEIAFAQAACDGRWYQIGPLGYIWRPDGNERAEEASRG